MKIQDRHGKRDADFMRSEWRAQGVIGRHLKDVSQPVIFDVHLHEESEGSEVARQHAHRVPLFQVQIEIEVGRHRSAMGGLQQDGGLQSNVF